MAVYVSAHGMGHSVRVAAVLSRLAGKFPLSLFVSAVSPPGLWPPSLRASVAEWRREVSDVGVVQSDDVTVDGAGTKSVLARWVGDLDGLLERETESLGRGFDLVVGDVPSPAFTAARRAEIPSVAIANFSWDWIYGELGFDAAAEAAAGGYADADLLLEASPAAPMRAFRRRVGVGLVARRATVSRDEARRLLGVGPDERVGLLAFQAASAPAVALPPRRPGTRWVVPAGWPPDASRDDVREIPAGFPFEDAVAAADVVVGKPGYGLIGDVGAAGVSFLFVPRPGFPENAVLVEHLRVRGGAKEVAAADLAAGRWEDSFVSLAEGERPRPQVADGADRAAEAIAQLLIDSGRGKL